MARQATRRLEPIPIGPVPAWVQILGAAFGCITLLALFGFAYLASKNPQFVCNSFSLLAAAFALGAALSAGFIGGAAAVSGSFGPRIKDNALAYSAGGGAAVLIITFLGFHYFKEENCSLQPRVTQQESTITGLKAERQKFMDQIKVLKGGPLEIVVNTAEPEPLTEILIQYYSKTKRDKKNAKVITDNVFEIDQSDLIEASPGIFVTYDPSKLPPERENQTPPPITIRRIDHGFDPLRIELYLEFPRTARLARVALP